jgi:hypothetical protein
MSDNPLADLERDAVPPKALRKRVNSSLQRDGLLQPPRFAWRTVALAASLAFTAALGFAAGRRSETTAVDATPRYLLMLREDSSYRDDRSITAIVSEYAAWADSLRRQGLLVLGEKLGDERLDLTRGAMDARPTGAGESPITGLFIIRAPNLVVAAAVAQSSPHLRYGGRIVLRPIEGTRRRGSGNIQ